MAWGCKKRLRRGRQCISGGCDNHLTWVRGAFAEVRLVSKQIAIKRLGRAGGRIGWAGAKLMRGVPARHTTTKAHGKWAREAGLWVGWESSCARRRRRWGLVTLHSVFRWGHERARRLSGGPISGGEARDQVGCGRRKERNNRGWRWQTGERGRDGLGVVEATVHGSRNKTFLGFNKSVMPDGSYTECTQSRKLRIAAG